MLNVNVFPAIALIGRICQPNAPPTLTATMLPTFKLAAFDTAKLVVVGVGAACTVSEKDTTDAPIAPTSKLSNAGGAGGPAGTPDAIIAYRSADHCADCFPGAR